MTNKQKIQNLVDRMPDDVRLTDAVYRMVLLKKVEEGLADIAAGRWIEHDELFEQLLSDDEENQANLVGKSKKRPSANKSIHRSRPTKNGKRIHQTTSSVRK